MDRPAGGIGKHLQHVILVPRIVIVRLEDFRLGPAGLPAGFCVAGVVSSMAMGVLIGKGKSGKLR